MGRTGLGYDIHPLVQGRPLILGGVEIHSDRGLDGHSDGDVLLHSLAEALLGGACLGDLGSHFPAEEARWKGADSGELLAQVLVLIRQAGWRLEHADATVVAQWPRLAPHRQAIHQKTCGLLGLDPSCLSVKFKSPEGLGALGAEKGIAAMAVVDLEALAAP